MSNDNIHSIPTKPDETKAGVALMERSMPDLIARADVIAQLRRANYIALTKAGFTPAEALTIVCGNPFL